MLIINTALTPQMLLPSIERMFEVSAAKLDAVITTWNATHEAPVYTVDGRYRTRGWTDWTLGFLFGSALLQYEAMGEVRFLESGRRGAYEHMQTHLTHIGGHDHGFNIVSTFGTLRRLVRAGMFDAEPWEERWYDLALKTSGAVQAMRWTQLDETLGYIHSFNGPHSLFIDTIRSLRSLVLAHLLGHALLGENERRINLLHRALAHAETTRRYNVYFGEGRDAFDLRGRVAHEAIFNLTDGSFRCPSTQQGFSPFTTWTRGLAWAICGFSELLECIIDLDETQFPESMPKRETLARFEDAACATAEYYIDVACNDGIPFWDTGAPGLAVMEHPTDRRSDPLNDIEPVDSSAAAIAAQGFLRLGGLLSRTGNGSRGGEFVQAGLTIASTLFREPYLSTSDSHEGLILHAVYHRPRGWDAVPAGMRIPSGESSAWGDYHARELGVMIRRLAEGRPPQTFADAAGYAAARGGATDAASF